MPARRNGVWSAARSSTTNSSTANAIATVTRSGSSAAAGRSSSSRTGRVARVIGTDTDVTRIKATETRLADALATMADALVLFDEDEKLVFCNEQFRRMFPKTPEVRVPGASSPTSSAPRSLPASRPGVTAENGDAYIEKIRSSLQTGGEWEFEMIRRALAACPRPGRRRWRLSQRDLRYHRTQARRAGAVGAEPPAGGARPDGRAHRPHQPPRLRRGDRERVPAEPAERNAAQPPPDRRRPLQGRSTTPTATRRATTASRRWRRC